LLIKVVKYVRPMIGIFGLLYQRSIL